MEESFQGHGPWTIKKLVAKQSFQSLERWPQKRSLTPFDHIFIVILHSSSVLLVVFLTFFFCTDTSRFVGVNSVPSISQMVTVNLSNNALHADHVVLFYLLCDDDPHLRNNEQKTELTKKSSLCWRPSQRFDAWCSHKLSSEFSA